MSAEPPNRNITARYDECCHEESLMTDSIDSLVRMAKRELPGSNPVVVRYEDDMETARHLLGVTA